MKMSMELHAPPPSPLGICTDIFLCPSGFHITHDKQMYIVTTGGWTTESATQAYLLTHTQVLLHGRLPESCHMTRMAGTRWYFMYATRYISLPKVH